MVVDGRKIQDFSTRIQDVCVQRATLYIEIYSALDLQLD